MNSVSILFCLLLKENFFLRLDRFLERSSTECNRGYSSRSVNAEGCTSSWFPSAVTRQGGKAKIWWFAWAVSAIAVPILLAGCAGGVHAAPSIAGTTATSGTGGGAPPSSPTPELTSIAITPNSFTIAPGATKQLVATATYSDGTTANVSSTASWTSATQSVAKVNASGLATAISSGSTTITASLSGFTATDMLTVSATAPTVTSIEVTPSSIDINVGSTQQLTATAKYSDGTKTNVSATAQWTSATESVATISSSGLATAVDSGSTSIRASLSGLTATGVLTVSPPATVFPVSIPNGAVSYPGLEKESGWMADASSSISPHPPAVYTINQTGPPVVMTLATKGASGFYTGWMVKKTIKTAGQLNMLIRTSYNFSSVTGIQAWEVGRRSTNSSRVTDNGQTQLVPIKGGLLEFDIVPSASGGWHDTGCRFPMFVANTTYNEELYYADDASGSLSLEYVELNGTVCTIPPNLQYITGASLGWAQDEATVAFQPDANPSAVPYNAVVTMNVWLWN